MMCTYSRYPEQTKQVAGTMKNGPRRFWKIYRLSKNGRRLCSAYRLVDAVLQHGWVVSNRPQKSSRNLSRYEQREQRVNRAIHVFRTKASAKSLACFYWDDGLVVVIPIWGHAEDFLCADHAHAAFYRVELKPADRKAALTKLRAMRDKGTA